MDKYVRAARERQEPWDRVREQRVLEETLRRLDEDEQASDPPLTTGARRAWIAAAGVAVLLVGTVLTLLLLGPNAPDKGRVGFSGKGTPAATASTSLIRFTDGSEAVVYAGGRVVVREQGAQRILLDQLAGAASYRVTRRPERRFEILAEGLVIRVVGTRFKVTLLPARWVRVEVDSGMVEVEYEGQTVRLGAGDSLQVSRGSVARARNISRAAAALSPGPAMTAGPVEPPDPAPVRPAVRRTPLPRPAARVAPAMKPASPARPGPATARALQEERDRIADVMRKVDAARRAGRLAQAVKLIRSLITKYPRNWRVTTATFTLARIEHARRSYGAAARAYALYRRRSPSGPLAEDALAGEARARRAVGQKSFARNLARTYLKKYPQGTHAKSMRSVMR